jgi:hypothetical protein
LFQLTRLVSDAVTAWTGVLAMTLVVRDEEDILGSNLDYHLAQGVDVILVVDHGSSDRTPEILREYEETGRVQALRDDGPVHDQAPRVNRLLRIAAEAHGADWVIHSDADEFWMPAAGSLRDVFAAVPDRYGYVKVERNNFPPVPDDGRPFHERMVVRERRSQNLRGHPLEPKVAQRPAAAVEVLPGNHDLAAPVMDLAPDIGAVEVFHFPMRTFEQFEHKVINTGVGYELLVDRAEGVGVDQLELLETQRHGGLPAYYAAQVLDPERLDKALEAGEVVLEDGLQAFLRESPDRRQGSTEVQGLLRRIWMRAGLIDDARLTALRERDAAVARLSAELDGARQEVHEMIETLAAVRASKIMRYTAGARRAYYRLSSHR